MQESEDEPPIIYEPEPTVTPLTGNESEADTATLFAVCWLLCRYSSHAYIARAHTLFRGIVDAFTAWPSGAERFSAETFKTRSLALRDHQAACERGLALLERGRTADAYAAIAEAVSGLEPDDPRDNLHLSLRLVLDELGSETAIEGRSCSSDGVAYPLHAHGHLGA